MAYNKSLELRKIKVHPRLLFEPEVIGTVKDSKGRKYFRNHKGVITKVK